jgi:hypothetical protein
MHLMDAGKPERCIVCPSAPSALKRRGLENEKTYTDQLGPREWWLPKPAEQVPVSAGKLADWARRGWVHSWKTPAQRLWVLWADKQELKRLRKPAALSHRGEIEDCLRGRNIQSCLLGFECPAENRYFAGACMGDVHKLSPFFIDFSRHCYTVTILSAMTKVGFSRR